MLLFWLLAAPAAAHLTPNSEVRIRFQPDGISADIVIPQGDYARASGNRVGSDAAALAAARGFLLRNTGLRAPDGRAWAVQIDRIAFETRAGPPDLHVIARFLPPAGAPPARFSIVWRAVTTQLPRHFVLFLAQNGGKSGGELRVLGALQGQRQLLAVDSRVVAPGFAGAVRLGMAHIAGGWDHLLFLLTLLLPAPLLAAGGRWQGRRASAATFRQLAWIVTAFTIGHSLTLLASAALDLRLPVAPVEIGIALSILVSAIHAWRPIFPGREPVVAAGFGLVHGLAFATLVGNAGLGVVQRGAAILGFNLGIEIVQIAVVAAALPLLLALTASRHRDRFRQVCAALAGVAALALLAVRSGLIEA